MTPRNYLARIAQRRLGLFRLRAATDGASPKPQPKPELVMAIKGIVALLAAMSFMAPFPAGGQGAHSQSLLKQMLKITWEKGPDLPQGFQDSSGGIMDGWLVTIDGFCTGQTRGVVDKLGKYPRGFLKRVWALNLRAPQNGWQQLPDFPGTARQALSCVSVNNKIYCWGGFSDFSPFCYRDGYELSRANNQWKWERLPDLPWSVAGGGMCTVGAKIYLLGGADHIPKLFYTNSDRMGNTMRLGARLLVFDTNNQQVGWKELPACPGTPRWVAAVASVNGKIYAIGGATGKDNSSRSYCTVVDNWQFDPGRGVWSRLPDTPIATGNFPSGEIVYRHRYILLIGGYQYANVMSPSQTLSKPYGKPFKHYAANDYDSDVLVFDTRTNTFGRATPLPLNNNMPMAVLAGSQLNLIGGETGGAVIGSEYFGHHPDLYLIGRISPAGR